MIHFKQLSMFFLLTIASQHFAVATQPTQLPDASDLISNWYSAMYTDYEASQIKISIYKKDKAPIKRTADFFFVRKGKTGGNIFMKFLTPKSIKGTSFLSLKKNGRNSRQWIYFPAYKKARRLSSHSSNESFLDSDFSNSDISFEYENSYTYHTKGLIKYNGTDTYIVEGLRKSTENKAKVPYSKQILYIEKQRKIVVKCDFYGETGQIEKVITLNKWVKYGHRWAANISEVKNLTTNSRSVIEFLERNNDNKPRSRLFTLAHLESGR